MYSGTTLTTASGRIMGAHQKIDRVARNNLTVLLKGKRGVFPTSRDILHFEGKNGPDGIKRKSPSVNEPWHYFNPFDDDDTSLIDLIEEHYKLLIESIQSQSKEKTAFEAAWLAHALVDGLTPAHHYPYEEKLSELRGEGNETRTTIKDKLVLPGDNRRDQVKNNWKMWGPKGLMTTHGLFELGIAAIIAPLSFSKTVPTETEIATFQELGIGEYFKRTAREIAVLDLYQGYYKKGWTTKLSMQIRKKLVPDIIKLVTLSWYSAIKEAKSRS